MGLGKIFERVVLKGERLHYMTAMWLHVADDVVIFNKTANIIRCVLIIVPMKNSEHLNSWISK